MKPYFAFFSGRAGAIISGVNRSFNQRRRAFRFNLLPVPDKRIYASIPHAAIGPMFVFALMGVSVGYGQEKDSLKTDNINEVIVSAVRANTKTPVTFTNVSQSDIKTRNLGQDIPQLLNFLPSVVTTSDAGTGIGYTGIRVRGTDATRVNVTLNGVPYNDSESMGTFWVNLPDFASSTQNLQLQRGVGTSTNGAGAFGASLNLLTDSFAEKAGAEISNSGGSFNTRKHTVKFTTGLLGNHFEVAGRLSNIESDGFIDRAFASLKGYFLQGTYVNKGTMIKALAFGGTEKTYQSWYGLEDPVKLKNDRTYNPAGLYFDDAGKERFYDNQTDNYQQDHYQLHWTQTWDEAWSSTLAFHYTIGKGYYENYRTQRDLTDFGIAPQIIDGILVDESDLIDQKWLDNDFYGTTYSLRYRKSEWDVVLGGGINRYDGDHFGKVLWTRSVVLPQYGQKYYDDFSVKKDGNVFAKATYDVSSKISLFADLQYRRVSYDANAIETGMVRDRFDFFNPKAGLTYLLNEKNNFYASFARAHREPNRTDYESGNPRPERLDDYELGWRHVSPKVRLNVNAYYMRYHDQLVLTGALNDVGNPIRENSGRSYRLGVEIDGAFALTKKWALRPNLTVSRNRNEDFFFERDGVLTPLGDTHIAFSPGVVAANAITFMPSKNFQISLLTKLVGEQYMGNIDSEVSKLDSYSTTDINISYEWENVWFFKSVLLTGLVNNLFDYEYESNGYFYTYDDNWSGPGITTIEGAGFYPQAGINFLVGLTLKI